MVIDLNNQSLASTAAQFIQRFATRPRRSVSITQCVQLCEQLDFCLALEFRYFSFVRRVRTRCYLLVLLDDPNVAQETLRLGCSPGQLTSRRSRNYIVMQKSPSCFKGMETGGGYNPIYSHMDPSLYYNIIPILYYIYNGDILYQHKENNIAQ